MAEMASDIDEHGSSDMWAAHRRRHGSAAQWEWETYVRLTADAEGITRSAAKARTRHDWHGRRATDCMGGCGYPDQPGSLGLSEDQLRDWHGAYGDTTMVPPPCCDTVEADAAMARCPFALSDD